MIDSFPVPLFDEQEYLLQDGENMDPLQNMSEIFRDSEDILQTVNKFKMLPTLLIDHLRIIYESRLEGDPNNLLSNGEFLKRMQPDKKDYLIYMIQTGQITSNFDLIAYCNQLLVLKQAFSKS